VRALRALRAPRSLTSRLVLTAVALVVAATVAVAALTAVVMHTYLSDRLDGDVSEALAREVRGPGQDERLRRPPPDFIVDGQGVGTLSARIDDDGRDGRVLAEEPKIGADLQTLDDRVLDELAQVQPDVGPTTLDLPGLGSYRVEASTVGSDGIAVAGLPTSEVDDVVRLLLVAETVLVVLGALAAWLAGRVVVRRQLRPLTEVARTAHAVAELPLASGEIGVTERVPAHLTDEHTEVGQVGAALNTLLAHVEGSLDARHRSEQQVRQFVADASHELRTPLATIVGYTELARRRPDDAVTAATALGKVEEESARMTSLVEDLLLLARLDAGRPLAREPVDLTRLLLEAVADARVLAPEHRWRLELPEEATEVLGDEQRLHQVVTNLLTNARTHTPPGTTVTVAARPRGFAVHDDGPGFPADLVGADGRGAFERFARADAARTRTGGAGLGLALVEAIVAAHGGRVELRTAPGDSTIEVDLPAR